MNYPNNPGDPEGAGDGGIRVGERPPQRPLAIILIFLFFYFVNKSVNHGALNL